MQILSLRLLRAVLPSWDNNADTSRMQKITGALFDQLGRTLLCCNNDPTLVPNGKEWFLYGCECVSNKPPGLQAATRHGARDPNLVLATYKKF